MSIGKALTGRPLKTRPKVKRHTERDRDAHSKAIGDRCEQRRRELNWSTVDLATASGLTSQGIRHVESGDQSPRTWTIVLLATALEVPAAWLAFGVGEGSEQSSK